MKSTKATISVGWIVLAVERKGVRIRWNSADNRSWTSITTVATTLWFNVCKKTNPNKIETRDGILAYEVVLIIVLFTQNLGLQVVGCIYELNAPTR